MASPRILMLDLSRPLDAAEGSLFSWNEGSALFVEGAPIRVEGAAAGASARDAGPRAAPSLPAPERIGSIPPGRYRFMQWRPCAEAAAELPASGIMEAPGPAGARDLREGIEYFARELWWADEKTEGPWYFRALREDGKVAYQLLRRATAPRSPQA